MSSRKPPSAADLPHKLRATLESAEQVRGDWITALRRWREAVREDPLVIWRTPAVRIAVFVILAVVAFFGARWAIPTFTPAAGGRNFEKATDTATIFVACTRPDCLDQRSVKLPMDPANWKERWPLACEKCGQKSVYRAQRCAECRRFFATAPGAPAGCPHCAAKKAASSKPAKGPTSRPTGDDSEDGW